MSWFDRVARRVSRMTDIRQSCFMEVFEKCCVRKFEAIMKEANHPLHQFITFSKRSNRIILIKTNRERFRNSFLPYAVRLYAKNFKR